MREAVKPFAIYFTDSLLCVLPVRNTQSRIANEINCDKSFASPASRPNMKPHVELSLSHIDPRSASDGIYHFRDFFIRKKLEGTVFHPECGIF